MEIEFYVNVFLGILLFVVGLGIGFLIGEKR